MGLFDKFFKKEEKGMQSEKPLPLISHEEDWAFYLGNLDDGIGSFYIDLGVAELAPMLDKPNLAWVSLKMNYPREDGLSSSEEFDKLVEIEDALQAFIVKQFAVTYAGRLTTDGQRDFFFYFGETAFSDTAISETMHAFPEYQYEYGVKEDKDWTLYFELLYPNAIQMQRIQNGRVIDNLVENGDALTKKRQVDHWLCFKTENDRQLFLEKIEGDGFSIINQSVNAENIDFPFALQIARVDSVDIDSVNDYAIMLWTIANECDGDYDGWETSIEKD